MQTEFPHLLDLDAVYLLLTDYTRFHFPIVPYRVLATKKEELDEVYLEVAESEKTWDPPVELRAFAVPEDELYPLTRFGIEQVRDLLLSVAVPDLLSTGLAEQDPITWEVTLQCSRAGDRLIYTGQEYDVLQFVRGQMFANTDIPLYFLLNCEKVRPEAQAFAGI